MAKYNYVVKTKKGEVKQGKIEAPSAKVVEEVLDKKDYLVVNIEREENKFQFDIPFIGGVKVKDKAVAIRQLATMLDAGISMTDALKVVVSQTSNQRFREALEDVKKKVESGYSLSKAMREHGEIFDSVFVAVVSAGEETGKLAETLNQLAEELEDQEDFNSKFRAAMAYPIFVFIALIAVVGIMMVYVVPQLKSLFAGADMTLPLSTRMLLSVSGFVASWWWLILLLVIGIVLAIRYYIKISDNGKYWWAKFRLNVPVFGQITEQSEIVRFTNTLSLLLGTGVPILKAIKLAARSTDNIIYQKALQGAAGDVERGVPLSTPLEKSGAFPEIVTQMISVGEESGSVSGILEKLAGYYQDEVDSRIKMISSLIEPVVIVILGIGVGFVVFSIIIPVYQLSMGVM